jgi:hypothetical protein
MWRGREGFFPVQSRPGYTDVMGRDGGNNDEMGWNRPDELSLEISSTSSATAIDMSYSQPYHPRQIHSSPSSDAIINVIIINIADITPIILIFCNSIMDKFRSADMMLFFV